LRHAADVGTKRRCRDWFPLPGQSVFDHEKQQIAAVSRAGQSRPVRDRFPQPRVERVLELIKEAETKQEFAA
jgi:hypothetical protein